MEFYISVLLFCLVSAITPGPNNLMLMSSSVNHGVRRSLPHYLGICLGFPLLLAAIGLGLGSVFLNYPAVHQVVKFAGIAYLLFLAWKIANAANPHASASTQRPLTFFQAMAFQWVNPKAWIVCIGLIAAYTTRENYLFQVAFIMFSAFVVGAVCVALWMLLGAGLQGFLHSQARLRAFNFTMAGLLVLSVLPMAFTQISPS